MHTKDINSVMRLKEISEKYNIPVPRLASEVRQGKIKAVKSGKEYLVTISEVYRYLGIETTSESLKRELYIKELENKINKYETKIKNLENCVDMMKNIFIVDK